jgi:HlyD family secretion protein
VTVTDQHRIKPDKKTRRSWAKLVRRALAIGVVIAVVLLIVVAWLPKPVPVETATAGEGPLVVTVEEDGRTRVKDRYVVSAPLTGNLARIELRPGDAVEAGKVITYIVPLRAPLLDERSRAQAQARIAASSAAIRQADSQIERATAAAEFAKKEAERQRKLAAQNVTSQQALEQALLDERSRRAELTSAKFGARVARYELEMAKAALGHVKSDATGDEQFAVPSPIDGRVLRVIQESEGVVQAGAPLLEVGDPRALEIVVDVLTSDAVNVEPGSRVSVREWGGKPLDAVVRLVEPSAFTRLSALGVEEQRVNVVVDLDEPYEKWSRLGDGYRVEAQIEIYRLAKALKVPENALFRRERAWAAFVVQDGAAEQRTLDVGRRNGREAQILGGLAAGERVVVHPSDRVADGVDVVAR